MVWMTRPVAASGLNDRARLAVGHQRGIEPTNTMRNQDEQDMRPPAPALSLMGRSFSLPQSRAQRIALGVGLIVLGTFGFLPVLGFWMIPLGLLVLSYEFASVRRLRRRAIVWWERRRQTKRAGAAAPDEE